MAASRRGHLIDIRRTLRQHEGGWRGYRSKNRSACKRTADCALIFLIDERIHAVVPSFLHAVTDARKRVSTFCPHPADKIRAPFASATPMSAAAVRPTCRCRAARVSLHRCISIAMGASRSAKARGAPHHRWVERDADDTLSEMVGCTARVAGSSGSIRFCASTVSSARQAYGPCCMLMNCGGTIFNR